MLGIVTDDVAVALVHMLSRGRPGQRSGLSFDIDLLVELDRDLARATLTVASFSGTELLSSAWAKALRSRHREKAA